LLLAGTLLKYYNSERDVGYDPRGVLELQVKQQQQQQQYTGRGGFGA
jgi:hypothetical protein